MNRKFLQRIIILAFSCIVALPLYSLAQQSPITFQSLKALYKKPVISRRQSNPPTGLKLLTADQKAKEMKTHRVIQKVYLNRLGWQRVNAYRQKHKLPLLGTNIIAPKGQEIVSAVISFSPNVTFSKNILVADGGISGSGTTLPDAVDNSTSIWFPPIGNQGLLNSCAAFATTYYALSYVVARENNWTISNGDLTKIFSPKWTYNFVNYGEDGGSNQVLPLNLLQVSGASSWEDFPYDGTDYTSWPTSASIWRNALFQRINPYMILSTELTDGSSAGLQTIKQLLNNGDIINFATTPPPPYNYD